LLLLLIEDCGGFSYFWNAQTKVSEYALIIEWLDSVGIYANIRYNELEKTFFPQLNFNPIQNDCYLERQKTRSEATQQSIIKANEIYNNLNTKENEK